MEEVVFTYKIADIQREVEKRTSLIGKNRKDADKHHLLDEISMTDGEDFIFSEYLESATSDVYLILQPFGRMGQNGYEIYRDIVFHVIDSRSQLRITHEGENKSNSFDIDIYDSSIVQDNGHIYYAFDPINFIGNRLVNVRYRISCEVVSEVNGIEIVEEYEYVDSTSDSYIDDVTFDVDFDTALGMSQFKSLRNLHFEVLDYSLSNEISWNNGDMVIYTDASGNVGYYIMLEDGIESMFDSCRKRLFYDVRETVVYRIGWSDWQDKNMIRGLDRFIFDAIVNRIIYYWLEVVMPSESSYYELLYNECCEKIQSSLNRESRLLRRRYNWF